jgi:hypothetical protein
MRIKNSLRLVLSFALMSRALSKGLTGMVKAQSRGLGRGMEK